MSFRNPTSVQHQSTEHHHLSIFSRKFNVMEFAQVPQFLGLCNAPRCCKNATLAAMLLITLERSNKFIVTNKVRKIRV